MFVDVEDTKDQLIAKVLIVLAPRRLLCGQLQGFRPLHEGQRHTGSGLYHHCDTRVFAPRTEALNVLGLRLSAFTHHQEER